MGDAQNGEDDFRSSDASENSSKRREILSIRYGHVGQKKSSAGLAYEERRGFIRKESGD